MEDSLRLEFDGKRYARHTLPLDTLTELKAFQNLLLSLARLLWKKENPQKKRLPKGFADQFQLELSGIETGSAVPVMRRPLGQKTLASIEPDYFDVAFGTFVDILANAQNDNFVLPEGVDSSFCTQFNAFGASLDQDESIAFSRGSKKVLLDRKLRSKLVLIAREYYESALSLDCEIDGVVREDGLVRVVSELGPLEIPKCSPELVQQAAEILGESSVEDRSVRLVGLGLYDKKDKLVRIVRIDCLAEVRTKSEELSKAEQWNVYVAGLHAREDISRAQSEVVLQLVEKVGNVLPSAGMTDERAFRFSWHLPDIFLDIEIFQDGKVEWFFQDDTTSEVMGTEDEMEAKVPPLFFVCLSRIEERHAR